MKLNWKTVATLPILSALLLSACGVNNNEANKTAYNHDRGASDLQRVRYYPGDDTGAAGSNVNFNYNNRYHNMGIYDDENTNRQNQANGEFGNRNVTNERLDTNRNRTNKQNNENHIRVADRAADKITAMREVDQVNVFVTEDNAYVAAQLENNISKKQTKDVEKRISDIVKSTDRNINQVYVSVDPDFYNRTASYANDIRNGRPVTGFAEEFTNLVQRIFPTKR